MGVEVESDRSRGVSQQFGNDLRMDPGTEQERGRSVAEIVEPQVRYIRPIEQRPEAAEHVAGVKWLAFKRGKHEVMVFPGVSDPKPLLSVGAATSAERVGCNLTDHNLSSRLAGFRINDRQPFARDALKRAGDPHDALLKIYIAPPQPEKFTLPQASRNGEDVESLEAFIARLLQEMLHLFWRERPHFSSPGPDPAARRVV
jgi:hypothetical protein